MKQFLPPTRSAGRRRSFSVRIALTVAFVGSMLVGCAPASGPSTVSGGYAANGTVIVAEDGMVHGRGSSGAKVTLIQDRLVQLGYFISDTRGSYGYGTAHAVTAFQKVQGITRDGSAGPTTKWFLNHPGIPRGSSSSGRVIEVQLAKQVVLFVENGNVRWILDASSGASATPTPRGRYSIFRQVNGYRHAPLGTLYRPKYFNGGIALHGSSSVPTYPASHGCVRLTNAEADFMWSQPWGAIGTRVWVY